jgi:dimethylglycine dehydrogenase
MVDAADADVMGDEPIWAKVSTDYDTVEKPHGFGAPRFDGAGEEVRGSAAANGNDSSGIRGIVDGDWRVVGWVTSGGYAHYIEKSMAQGYVPAALAENESEGMFEIEILGRRRPARINIAPPFDPNGEKMRS